MNPRDALETLPVRSRVREALPVLSALLPTDRRGLRLVESAGILVVSAVLAALVLLVPDRPYGAFLLVAVLFALAGIRRGQDVYAQEAVRATSLAGLVGRAPEVPYLAATSSGVRRRARLVLAVFPVTVAALHLGAGAAPTTALLTAAVLAPLPPLALTLRGLVGHGAVLAQHVRVPQYAYLVGGLLLGASLHVVWFRRGGLPGGEHLTTWHLVAAAGVLVAWLVLDRLLARAGVVATVDATRFTLPRRPARRRLPLTVYLWRARGRARSSLVIGFTAIVTVLALNLGTVVDAIPTLDTTYARPELAMVVVYAFAYLLCTVAAIPLDLRGTAARAAVLRLVGARGDREVRHHAGSVLLTATVGTGVVVAAMLAGDAFPGVPVPVVVAACAVLVVAALNVNVVPEVARGDRVGHGPADDFPLGEVLRSGLVGLLAAALAAGFVTSTPVSPGAVAAVVAGLLAVAAGLVTRLVLVVRHTA